MSRDSPSGARRDVHQRVDRLSVGASWRAALVTGVPLRPSRPKAESRVWSLAKTEQASADRQQTTTIVRLRARMGLAVMPPCIRHPPVIESYRTNRA